MDAEANPGGYSDFHGRRGSGAGGAKTQLSERQAGFEPGQRDAAGAARQQGKEAFDLAEVAGKPRLLEQGAQQAAANGSRIEPERGGVEHGGVGQAAQDEGGEEAVDFGSPVLLVFERHHSGVGEDGFECRIPVPLKLRDQLGAEAVAGKAGVGVRGVFPPGDAAGTQEMFGVAAGDVKQWANDAFAGDGEDAGEPAPAGAAEEAEEDGFGLIRTGVPGGNTIEQELLARRGEKGKASAARGIFEVARVGWQLDAVAEKGEVSGSGKFAHEGFVGVGFSAAQAMVEMKHGGCPAELGEGFEQGDGIAPAGDGKAEAVARREHVITKDGRPHRRHKVLVRHPLHCKSRCWLELGANVSV